MPSGKHVLKFGFVEIDATDLSDHCSSISLESTFDEVDLTGMGGNYKEYGQGMGDLTLTLDVFQDHASASVDDTLWPLSQTGEAFDVVLRTDDGVVSATNPEYRFSGKLFSYSPISGSVGDANTTSVSIRNGAQTGLTRHTS